MQRSDNNQSRRLDDEAWYFLAEYSLGELLPDHELRNEHAGKCLFPDVRGVELPPECMETIYRALAEFAKEALDHFKKGRVGLPGRVRVFCQRKLIDDAASVCSALRLYNTEQAVEDLSMNFNILPEMNGGWGCFIIEKGGKPPTGSLENLWSSVDLFLYREDDASRAFGRRVTP